MLTMDGATKALEAMDAEAQEAVREVVSFTWHARRRGARRNVAPDAIEYVLAHGRMIHRTGAVFFFLGRRDIPVADRRASWAARLEGTIVIVENGEVVTVYRNRRGWHRIARKMKYRLYARKPHALDADDEARSLLVADATA